MQTTSVPKAYKYKMVVLGHYFVGKSSIVLKFAKDEFNPCEESTIGASFISKTIPCGENTVKYEIWDTAGQERYYSLIPMYYRGAQVALIIYDVTSQESFDTAKNWVEELKYDKPSEFLKVIVANKIDLKDEAVVTKEVGKEYATRENLLFYEVSAKTGEGISKLFSEIASILPKEQPPIRKSSKIRKSKNNLFCCWSLESYIFLTNKNNQINFYKYTN